MRVRIFLVLFFLFFSFPGCFAQNQNKVLNPKEEDTLYLWDFGEVSAAAVLKHTFILRNNSPFKALNIKDITVSCGCLLAQVEKKIISSGGAVELQVKFDPKGYSGTVQQFVYVSTDNPDNPILKFTIKAKVVK